jgi:hypothetical protein
MIRSKGGKKGFSGKQDYVVSSSQAVPDGTKACFASACFLFPRCSHECHICPRSRGAAQTSMESEVASSNDVGEAHTLHRTTRRVSVTLESAAYYERASRLVGKPEDKFMHFGSRALCRSFRAPGTLLRAEAAWRVTANGRFTGERIGTGSAGSRPRLDRGVRPLWSNPICLDAIPPTRYHTVQSVPESLHESRNSA